MCVPVPKRAQIQFPPPTPSAIPDADHAFCDVAVITTSKGDTGDKASAAGGTVCLC
jgi:hypothetical protein